MTSRIPSDLPARRGTSARLALLAGLVLPGALLHASPAQDYMLYCMGCHGTEAQGVPGKVPALAHSLGHYLRTSAGRDFIMRVPGAANSALSDAQLAAVLNWLVSEYNAAERPADFRPFTTGEVAQARHSPLPGVQSTRAAVIRELAATGAAPNPEY